MNELPPRPALRWITLAVALGCLALTGTTAPADDDSPGGFEEPSTGLVFPLERSAPGSERPLALAGAGVRKKLFFKVYALGLYLDDEAASRELEAWSGRPAAELEDDPELYRALIGLSGQRLAVLRFVREVSASRMRDAMLDALTAGSVPANDPHARRFLGLWKKPIEEGETVSLLFTEEGLVRLARDGTVIGELISPRVAEALLTAWLGQDPVSETVRDGVVARLPHVIRGGG